MKSDFVRKSCRRKRISRNYLLSKWTGFCTSAI